ncbi:MAG: ribosome silencing factor [Bacilli bacterium]|nr:ribosome silencing factor [Bacilli bacterium]
MDKLKVVFKALEDVNAVDIVVYDMREISPFYDYFVISSATSDRQLHAAITHINDDFAKAGYAAPNIEGKTSKSWVLVDAKDIIINIFTKEEREYYHLEKMFAGFGQVDTTTLK